MFGSVVTRIDFEWID